MGLNYCSNKVLVVYKSWSEGISCVELVVFWGLFDYATVYLAYYRTLGKGVPSDCTQLPPFLHMKITTPFKF